MRSLVEGGCGRAATSFVRTDNARAVARPVSQQQSSRPIRIAADHPAAAGHFPGNPLVPGVVLLDEVISALREERFGIPSAVRIVQAKFHAPVKFGEALVLTVLLRDGHGHDFSLRRDGVVVASGRLE